MCEELEPHKALTSAGSNYATSLNNLQHLFSFRNWLNRLTIFFFLVIRKKIPSQASGTLVARYVPRQVMRGQMEEAEAGAEIFPSPALSGKFNRVTRYHKSLKGREKKTLVPRKRRTIGPGGLNLSGMSGVQKKKKKKKEK